ncbi:App1 family protein [Tessaracoccus antarcticus]|uniref:DUF2183 domain-containing protein n=1 Tax=Tessaracoccus antarcticus TaxID=2479848 RepID=A0A3M0G5J4_9ACTN|nr:phosphatase domain-containing protein [Tessaracoccus antarcticus]RMB60321.1 DUF2183 domain-containing protein [Tessaracoccus antarcticus]
MKSRPFFAARIEDHITNLLSRMLSRRGWDQAIVGYTGFGTPEQVRVLARVVLKPPKELGIVQAAYDFLHRRGWRNFIAAPLGNAQAWIILNGAPVLVQADRSGYIDVRVKNPGLAPGWHTIEVRSADGSSGGVEVQIIDSEETFGIVSDIDDTILSTWLPRPFLAAWNSFFLTEQARQAVPGIARFYQGMLADHPGAPVIYVSTGAWNTYPMVSRFLARHGIPKGAMLLTDWGPTNTGWFRKGPDHKRTCLRELARDLPNIRWVLVGDDGQHDPELYAEFATLQPRHVRARAIRQLTPGEHVLAHAMPFDQREPERWSPDTAPEVRAPDGDGLADKLRTII